MKYSSLKTQQICISIAQGYCRLDACLLSDIDESTLYRWLSDNASFASELQKAELKYKGRLVKMVEQAGAKDWRAALKLLERKYRLEYGDQLSQQPIEGRLTITQIAADMEKGTKIFA